MRFPVPILDSANRTPAEIPLSDQGHWTSPGAIASVGLNLNNSRSIQRVDSAPTFGRNGCWRNDHSWPANTDVQVSIDIVQMTTDGECDIGFWNPATGHGYYVAISNAAWGAGNNYAIDILGGGAGLVSRFYPPVAGDTVIFAIEGPVLAVGLVRSGVLLPMCSVQDTTYREPWYAFLEIAGLNDTTTYLVNNFGASNLPPPYASVLTAGSQIVKGRFPR